MALSIRPMVGLLATVDEDILGDTQGMEHATDTRPFIAATALIAERLLSITRRSTSASAEDDPLAREPKRTIFFGATSSMIARVISSSTSAATAITFRNPAAQYQTLERTRGLASLTHGYLLPRLRG